MNFIIYLFFSFWFIRILVNILSYGHLWFVKEYRWDRMLIHLKTKQGKMILFPPLRRPPVSPKSIFLSGTLCIFVLAILIWLPVQIVFRFILADLFLFPAGFILVGILKLPTVIYHRIKIAEAMNKLAGHGKMTVIGISGSYGKTSTKEYLATILGRKFKVLKTEASKNAAIGIAEVILSGLKPDHEVFVAEMGAYKTGEIKEMTGMIKPEIGIITAINPQHQDLFGSIETTMKAKYELTAGLTGKKIAIFNTDNERVRQMAEWTVKDGIEIWSVGLEGHRIPEAHTSFVIKNIKADLKGISFDLAKDKEVVNVKAHVLGVHQATNISLAIAAAIASGMSLKVAAAAAASIRSYPKTMQPMPGVNGSLFINDTFNNNPDAAIAALDLLNKNKGRKILVFQPMIELGSFAGTSHERVGERAGKVCDEIILTNNNFYEYFASGVAVTNSARIAKVMTPESAAGYLRKTVGNGDAVLFKGKEAELVLKRLT